MNEVANLVEAFDRIGSPLLQVKRPGLTPDGVRAAAAEHLPQHWARYADEQVFAWYGWQNGADDDNLEAGGEAMRARTVITPDGFKVAGIHELLGVDWEGVGPEYANELGIVFLLGPIDGFAADLYLHKQTPDDEWTVWNHWMDSGLLHPENSDGYIDTPATFPQWLTALTEAINTRRLILGRSGNVTVPGEGVAITNAHCYPWNDAP